MQEHQDDYQALFNRVSLHVGEANIKAMKSGPYTIAYQGRTSSVEFKEDESKTITF